MATASLTINSASCNEGTLLVLDLRLLQQTICLSHGRVTLPGSPCSDKRQCHHQQPTRCSQPTSNETCSQGHLRL